MRRHGPVLLAIVALAAMLAGCGGSSRKTTSSAAPSAKQREQADEARLKELLHLRGRLLRTDELSGFSPVGRRLFGTETAGWLAAIEAPLGKRAREAERLNRLGFRGGLEERLRPTTGGAAEGISVVGEFPSDEAARSELAAQAQIAKTEGATEFPVSGVPGARGFGEPGNINVAFVDGRYYYLVGAGFPPGSSAAPSRSALITAAKRLFARLATT
jgi:hypothetical protein